MRLLPKQDMKYKMVVFDFDGTIADSSEGILDAHRYTLNRLEISGITDEKLRLLIGGNLLSIYQNEFGLEVEAVKEAVRLYRKRYSEYGIMKAKLYPDFIEVTKKLKENSVKIAIATLKADSFVKQMVENLNISKYFDYIHGMKEDDSLSKADLIDMCVSDSGFRKSEVLFVGDSIGDYYGATKSNVDFVGVSYGFGFSSDIKYDFEVVDTSLGLLNIVELG